MTAVEASRASAPGAGPSRRPTPGAGGPRSGPFTPRRVAVVVVVLCMAIGGVGAALLGLSAAGRYQSTATVVFTSTENADQGDISAGSRFVQDRLGSWAAIASSDSVRNRAAELSRAPGSTPFGPSAVTVSAVGVSGTEIVEVTTASDDAAAVPAQATDVARALSQVVVSSERYPGLALSRVTADVASPGGATVDAGMQDAQWWAVLGIVAGFVVGLLGCSLLRPGGWARDIAPTPVPAREQTVDLNGRAMGDELQRLVRSLRRPAGRFSAVAVVVSVAGYGLTGWMIFPLAAVLAAALWSWHTADPRWSTTALLFIGIGVFPEKVDVVRLGPVTPTVLEVALVLAIVVAVRFAGASRPQAAFTGPVLAIVGAVLVGSVVTLAKGGDFASMIDNTRAILVVVGFFPVYLAFARRPHQLVAVLLAIGGICSSVVLVASFAGWSRLLVDERTSVITGSETSSVSRLSSPVLDLWAPLLILLLSALVPRRPRWLWFGLVIIGVLHQALSFNRSTWVPLILLVVAVAAVTHGPRGLVRRAVALALVGAVGLTLALTGLLGSQGRAIANRATSVVTGQAYGEDSLPDRLRENTAALITLRNSPWVGTGVGQNYGGELITYDSEHSRVVVEPRPYIHNQYLRIWLFMGILGLLAYAFAGVRILALTAHAWFRRAAAAPMVVAVAMGLACLAAQSILQTTLVARPTVLTTVALMAAAAAFASWAPTPDALSRSAPAAATSNKPAAAGVREE